MNHKKLLGYLPRDLVEPITHDVARVTAWAMLDPEKKPHEVVTAQVLKRVFLRWDCVLKEPCDEANSHYKDLVCLTMAAVLHRHGFCDEALTRTALDAVDTLNEHVVLSDNFERNSDAIKALLTSPPTPLVRRPPVPKNLTFWREGDAASVQIGEWFYAIYVYEILGNHEAPIVEIYDFTSRQRPEPEDLRHCKAKGQRYNDGVMHIDRHAPYGLRDVPDRARQFQILATGLPAPRVDHLQPSIGLFAVSDPFTLLQDIQHAFGHD